MRFELLRAAAFRLVGGGTLAALLVGLFHGGDFAFAFDDEDLIAIAKDVKGGDAAVAIDVFSVLDERECLLVSCLCRSCLSS